MGSATLAGAEVNIVTTNDNPVIVNGVTYTKGQVVTKLTTDENGCAQTTADLLPSGTYSAVEIKAPQGTFSLVLSSRTLPLVRMVKL